MLSAYYACMWGAHPKYAATPRTAGVPINYEIYSEYDLSQKRLRVRRYENRKLFTFNCLTVFGNIIDEVLSKYVLNFGWFKVYWIRLK